MTWLGRSLHPEGERALKSLCERLETSRRETSHEKVRDFTKVRDSKPEMRDATRERERLHKRRETSYPKVKAFSKQASTTLQGPPGTARQLARR